MKKLLAVLALTVCMFTGIALAQQVGQPQGANIPRCPTGFALQCAKIFQGTSTACRCLNSTTNAALGVIAYTPAMVNALQAQASSDDATVAVINNAQ